MRQSPSIESDLLTIGAAEAASGVPRDTLRAWERRYGFPEPSRDARGVRVYSRADIERLQLVRQLVDQGARPSRVVQAGLDELRRIARSNAPTPPIPPDVESAIEDGLQRLKAHDFEGLRGLLMRQLVLRGLDRIVGEFLAPFSSRLGDAWSRGEVEVFEEHIYAEIVGRLLRAALEQQASALSQSGPTVVLATLPGERHGLGLLMAEVLLSARGCRCIQLGVETPADEIVAAARECQADVVGISFSLAATGRQIASGLHSLKERLAGQTPILAGGANPLLQGYSKLGFYIAQDTDALDRVVEALVTAR